MRKQRGVTMIGWIFLLVPMAIVLYAGLRIGPEYFNYYKVVSAMKETAKQLEPDETLSPQSILSALGKRFDTGYIDDPKVTDIQVAKVEEGWQITADYERTVPLFGNMYLLVVFKNSTVIH